MIRNLRTLGLIEALSFLLLAGVAMPLKYVAHQPQAVKILGPIHGGLWVLYIGLLGVAFLTKKLPFKLAFLLGVSSMLPFGPLLFESKLKALETA
jgi:integral membrane protein